MESRRRGSGAVLQFVRVCERQPGAFQPLRSLEIMPATLDRLIKALKRWGFEIVDLDEACRRATAPPQQNRFVCLTFDGVDKSIIDNAWPVLARHRVPFALFVPTAFPDGVGAAWWLALEAIVARHDRIGLVMEGHDRVFAAEGVHAKGELFALLARWLMSLPPQALAAAMHDLCSRYSVDLAALTRASSMGWDGLSRLAADPLVTFGAATVNYSRLANMPDADALRELTMGRAVLQAALGSEIRHTAFPFGDRDSFNAHHSVMAANAGFVSAATCVPGLIAPDGETDLHALPRIAWDGRHMSLRTLRALLAGVTL